MKVHCHIRIAAILLLYVASGIWETNAETTNCLKSLISPSENPYRYMDRTGRCEGLYEKPKKGHLYMVSFGESAATISKKHPPKLIISWSSEKSDPVHLSGYALHFPYSESYKMDKIMANNPGKYEWPLDIVYALGLSAKDVGIICRTKMTIGNREKVLYYPVRLMENERASYQAVFRSDSHLRDLTFSLAELDPENGFPSRFIYQSKKIAADYITGNLITIDLSKLGSPGYYLLTIKAVNVSGGLPTGQTIWFFYDGK
jgi:hypothetical protein